MTEANTRITASHGVIPSEALPPGEPAQGTLRGREASLIDKGVYCVALPVALVEKVAARGVGLAGFLSHRYLVAGTSSVAWGASHAVRVACKVGAFVGRLFQGRLTQEAMQAVGEYNEAVFEQGRGARERVAGLAGHVVSYIPLVGPLVQSAEKAERAAEEAAASTHRGIIQRLIGFAASIFPAIGKAVEASFEYVDLKMKKVTDITYIGMTNPGRVKEVLQNASDILDSYAARLLSIGKTPEYKPDVPLCSPSQLSSFLQKSSVEKNRILQKVVTSSLFHISNKQQTELARLLSLKQIEKLPEKDQKELRELYSDFLYINSQKETREQSRKTITDKDVTTFFSDTPENLDEKLFLTLA
jgi:hypothetical protein